MTSHSEHSPPSVAPSWIRILVMVLAIGVLIAFLAWSGKWLFDTVEGLAAQWEVTEPSFNVGAEPASPIVTESICSNLVSVSMSQTIASHHRQFQLLKLPPHHFLAAARSNPGKGLNESMCLFWASMNVVALKVQPVQIA